MLLGLFIPIGTFHTAEEKRVHNAYVLGPDKPTIEEVDKAIEGSFRYTERITMLIAVPLAPLEYVLYLRIRSRRQRQKALAQSAPPTSLA